MVDVGVGKVLLGAAKPPCRNDVCPVSHPSWAFGHVGLRACGPVGLWVRGPMSLQACGFVSPWGIEPMGL